MPDKSGRLVSVRLVILLLLFIYSGLAAYSGSFLPMRLIKGTSMEPALFSGDIVLVQSVPFSDIRKGDIVAYKTPDAAGGSNGPSAILHRVLRTEIQNGKRVLITKGDNSNLDPWPVTSSLVQGRMVYRIPWVGKPVVFLTTTRGILFVSIAILISLLYIPAMLMFHVTVIRRPGSSDLRDTDNPTGSPEVAYASATLRGDHTVSDIESAQEFKEQNSPELARSWLSEAEDEDVSDYQSDSVSEAFPYRAANSFWQTSNESGAEETIRPVVEAVETLTVEQSEIKDSLLQLSNSIAQYAVHLQSHTTAVQSLASVAQMLEENIKQQRTIMEEKEREETKSSSEQEPSRKSEADSHRPRYLNKSLRFDQDE